MGRERDPMNKFLLRKEKVKFALKLQGVQISDVARLAGRSIGYTSNIISGWGRSPEVWDAVIKFLGEDLVFGFCEGADPREKQTPKKLSPRERQEQILECRRAGLETREIATICGCTHETVRRVVDGRY